jgi:hypothetical protein
MATSAALTAHPGAVGSGAEAQLAVKRNETLKESMKMRNMSPSIACGLCLMLGTNLYSGPYTPTDALTGWTGGAEEQWGAGIGYTLGWEFTANSDLSVSSLGIYDAGISANHEVGIWTTSGTLLASATVTPSTPDGADSFAWVGLGSPVNLSDGQTYLIGADYPAPVTDTFVYQASSDSTASGITYITSANSLDVGFGAPSPVGAYNDAYFGPNFQFTEVASVPEPSTLALFVMGGLGGLRMLRRRK